MHPIHQHSSTATVTLYILIHNKLKFKILFLAEGFDPQLEGDFSFCYSDVDNMVLFTPVRREGERRRGDRGRKREGGSLLGRIVDVGESIS